MSAFVWWFACLFVVNQRLKLCAPVSGGKEWTRRCDQQRVTHEREMTLLNEDLARLKAEKANVEDALRQARSDAQVSKAKQKVGGSERLAIGWMNCRNC